MKVAMMQPSFLPWLGFFELIYQSDRFIFLDDFQFSVQSTHQRNRLFVNKGKFGWYTAPIQKSVSFKAPLNQTKINEKIPWRKKMWKSIELNYSKAFYYPQISPLIKNWLLTEASSLAKQNMDFIRLTCNLIGFKTDFRLSSQYLIKTAGSQRVLELLRKIGAHRYYCAKGSFAYMQKDGIFPVDDIEVLFQNFIPKPYKQIGSLSVFVPSLSILDALFNVGPEETFRFIKEGTEKWLSWEEMIASFRQGKTAIHQI